MALKVSLDEILANAERKSIQEYKGDAKIVSVAEYRGQTGKLSIKVEFDVDGAKFGAYSGLTEASVKITLSKITQILIAAVGEAKAKEIFDKCASDEDVNNETDLAIMLAQKTNAKLRNTTVIATVERTIAEKDEQGKVKKYNIKWYIKNEGTPLSETKPKDADKATKTSAALPESSDDFLNTFNA